MCNAYYFLCSTLSLYRFQSAVTNSFYCRRSSLIFKFVKDKIDENLNQRDTLVYKNEKVFFF